jgi:hypothetical protein
MVLYAGDTTADRRKALEDRITAQRVVQCFDDDGDGRLEGTDLDILALTLADADDIVTGLLLNKGFSLEHLERIKTDRQIVRAWSSIAAQLAGERRTEWLNERGQGIFDAFGARGRAELGALARGEIRSVHEPEVGANRALTGEVERRAFIFAPDPNDPNDRGPGGF